VNPNIHHRARIVVSLIDRAVISSPSPPLARASPSNAPPSPPRSPSAPAPKPARFARRAPSVPIIAIPSFASSSSSGRPLPSRPSPSVVARRPPRPRSRARPRFRARRSPARAVLALCARASIAEARVVVDAPPRRVPSPAPALLPRRSTSRARAGLRRRATTPGDARGGPTDRFLCRVGKQCVGSNYIVNPSVSQPALTVVFVFGFGFSVFRFFGFSVFRASRRVDRARARHADAPTRGRTGARRWR